MPNHVHVVVRPIRGYELPGILHSWKSFTAKQANKILNRGGQFWQHEYYDHLIRDENDFRYALEYVLSNPEHAGFHDWPWVGLQTAVQEQDAPAAHGRDAHATHGQDARATAGEFAVSRRTFMQALGAGLLITVTDGLAWGQRGGGRSEQMPVVARLHLNEDGTIAVMSGKVEEGQGARTELSQAAAEELRVPFDRIRIVMADTDFVPDDGGTSGSRTTPQNVPPMRQAAATARELLTRFAAKQWQVDASTSGGARRRRSRIRRRIRS